MNDEERQKVLELLKEVVDPEIGINIVDLGLIYELKIDGKKVYVRLGMTSPFCPYAPIILAHAHRILEENGYEPDIDLDLETQWTPDRMNPELRKKLGL